jgi:hypothetical protein
MGRADAPRRADRAIATLLQYRQSPLADHLGGDPADPGRRRCANYTHQRPSAGRGGRGGDLPAALLLLLAWRNMSPFSVRPDEQGLRWRTPAGLPRRLLWRDARSFFTLTYPRLWPLRLLMIRNDTVYGVESESAAFAWRIDATATERDPLYSPSATLFHLVAEHTGLRVRDVSEEAKRIAAATQRLTVKITDGKIRVVEAGSPESLAERRRHRLRVVGIALAPFLLLVVVSLVAMLAQTPYYEHLYAQSHVHSPLYVDPLTQADADWPRVDFASFTGGAYHFVPSVDSGDILMYVPTPRAEDQALYEVTSRIDPGSDVQGIGLAIAVTDRNFPELTFGVNPSGGWEISYWSPGISSASQFFNSGSADWIHRGFGAANRVAVLVRGADYVFFVNSHYAGSYQNDKLVGGHIGLYLDSLSNAGDFNDFAVYPLG